MEYFKLAYFYTPPSVYINPQACDKRDNISANTCARHTSMSRWQICVSKSQTDDHNCIHIIELWQNLPAVQDSALAAPQTPLAGGRRPRLLWWQLSRVSRWGRGQRSAPLPGPAKWPCNEWRCPSLLCCQGRKEQPSPSPVEHDEGHCVHLARLWYIGDCLISELKSPRTLDLTLKVKTWAEL